MLRENDRWRFDPTAKTLARHKSGRVKAVCR
jgi:hypothetical protein